MHEGHHGIISEAEHHAVPVVSQRTLGMKLPVKKFIFPGLLLVSIIAAAIPGVKAAPGFDIALLPMLVGGGYITWTTLVAVIQTKRITAGIMVVLALIGTAYVGEYLAGAVVAFMMISGEFLEDITLERTRNAVREIIKLVPETARVKTADGYQEVRINRVKVGDTVLVKPGERIPVDGVVTRGQSAVNEASLTGESLPVDKTNGDKVFVGTFNENGALEVLAEKVGRDSALGRIITVIRQAQQEKGEIQRTADRFAQYFTPVILTICAVVWLASHDLYRVMSVLVIACPCALVLATPTAVVASVGNAARRGGIIKGGTALEAAGKVTTVCLDKTGTITQGKVEVVDVEAFGADSAEMVIRTAAIAEKYSQHPIGAAITDHAGKLGMGEVEDAENFTVLPGRGVRVEFGGRVIEVSNMRAEADHSGIFSQSMLDYARAQEALGRTVMFVIEAGNVIGAIAVADVIRPDAAALVQSLKAIGIRRVVMLTGDNAGTAAAIAAQAGIADYRANLLPEDKLKVIRELKEKGETVAMVGDGVNDAPALVLADIGIAMGVIGTDVAIESSDIALMSENLPLIPELLGLSRHALTLIKQNIWVFAVGVNLIGIALASSGFLSPIAGAIVHNIASILVVGNSARLLTYRHAY